MLLLKNLGYSAWGFLGNGIVDTPDGGRSHRMVLLRELMRRGIHIHLLQKNRDLLEAGEDFTESLLSFDASFPDIDALFIEYRWKISGRNYGVRADDPDYTPDLDRQDALLEYYLERNIPIIVWDKDQRLDADDRRFKGKHVMILEPGFIVSEKSRSMLFPMNEFLLQAARENLARYDPHTRTTNLLYIGNQYERDQSFSEYCDKASLLIGSPAQVYGKWSGKNSATGESFKNVTFHGRIGYKDVAKLYANAFATVLIAPDRYYESGHYTQRLFEACWGGCLPFVPKQYAESDRLFPAELIVESAEEFAERFITLRCASATRLHNLFDEIYKELDVFSPAHQADALLSAIEDIILPGHYDRYTSQ